MADVQWIKIHTGIFDDEKIKLIDSMPDRDAVFVIWVKLLALAGKVNDKGLIYVSEEMPYTCEMYAAIFNRPINTVKMALDLFEKFEMIEIIEGKTFIKNWSKHQNIDGLEKIRIGNKTRQAKYREKLKIGKNSNVTNNVTVTNSNGTDKEEDKEKNVYILQHYNLKLTKDEKAELTEKHGKKDVDNMIKKIKSLSADYLRKYDSMYLIIDAWIEKEKENTGCKANRGDNVIDMIMRSSGG